MKTWINVEKIGAYNSTAVHWEVKNIYTVPRQMVFDNKYISWVTDVSLQTISLANMPEYNGVFYVNDKRDDSNFYVVPTFAHHPYPYQRRFKEFEKIEMYFDASILATFDYVVIRLCGWLMPYVEAVQPEEQA